jgi:hypothetical protein
MTRNLKALGLALAAVFAMSAIAASAAQATPTLTSETSPVTLTGTGGGLGSGEKLVAFKESVECEKSTYHTALTAASVPEITIEAEYGPECRTGTGLRATVTMNGCTYLVYDLKFNATGKDYDATVDIICPVGKVIEVHVYASKAAHEAKTSLCTWTIPAQQELEKATITTKTTEGKNFGDVTLQGTIKIKEIIEHRNSILCPDGPEKTVTTEGEEIIPGVTIEGRDKNGNTNDIDITGE